MLQLEISLCSTTHVFGVFQVFLKLFFSLFFVSAEQQLIPIEVVWEPFPGAVHYNLEIASDPDFVNNYQVKKELKKAETILFLKQGLYYIRIQGFTYKNQPGQGMVIKKNILIRIKKIIKKDSPEKKPAVKKAETKDIKKAYTSPEQIVKSSEIVELDVATELPVLRFSQNEGEYKKDDEILILGLLDRPIIFAHWHAYKTGLKGLDSTCKLFSIKGLKEFCILVHLALDLKQH